MFDPRNANAVIPASSLYRQRTSGDKSKQMKEESKGANRALYHANYTKENYNILTLQQHNDYYQQYQQKIPVYVREQPDWAKSLYKKKHNKVNQYNYILYRNVRNVSGKADRDRQSVGTSGIYKESSKCMSKDGHRSFMGSNTQKMQDQESLPLIMKKNPPQKDQAVSKVQEMCKRSLSSYCSSKAGKKSRSSVVSGAEKKHLSEAEKMIQRAEQLGKFVKSLGKDTGKEIAVSYANKLLEKCNLSDIAKEQIKIAIEKPPEDVEKMVENALQKDANPEHIEEKKELTEEEPKEKTEDEK